MELSMWEKYIEHYMDEKHVKRAAINKENRKKNKVYSMHGSQSLAASRHRYFETSETQEYPSLIQSYYDQPCKNGEWRQDEARANYEEMCRLRDLGTDNPTGRPYTEEEILAMVLKGKQRGKVAGVGRVLSGKMILPPVSPRSSSYDKEKIDEMMAAKDKKIADLQKKTEEQAKESKAVQRLLSEFFQLVQTHPPDRWSELMSQIPSRSDVGSGSGAGGSGGGGSVDLDEEGSDYDDDDE